MKMKQENSTLAALADIAIDAIRTLVTDPNTPPAVRLRAAKLILDSKTDCDNNAVDGNAEATPASKPATPAHTPMPERLLRPAPVGTQNSHVRPPPKVGRNDYCPCGSGLKFKKCCLQKLEGGGRTDRTQTAGSVPPARAGAPAAAPNPN